ncbi:VOC family protein [Streptomyces thermocoprophilus]|uniref:VOC family protein n=1 Tax=Streptomyces thermocoprophilus TaxID=78356 RepID=A0ABV5VH61_9ACTN
MLTTRFVDGSPDWIDVGTPDVQGASVFYGALFGWRYVPAPASTGGYGFFQLDGRTVAGGMQTGPGQGPPSWTVYFRSPDAQAAARAAEQAHSRVLEAPQEMRGEGCRAVLADRAGAPFGIWQPGRTAGLELAGTPGTLFWVELHTPDIAAAAAFYHAVLGLETAAVQFPGGVYTGVGPAGYGEAAMFGGLVPSAGDPEEAEASWLPYFAVTGTDAVVARAEELGGTVRIPPTDVEGVGRAAWLTDPYGARFAVIRSMGQR